MEGYRKLGEVTGIHGYRYFGHVDNRWLSTGEVSVRFVQCCHRQKAHNASNGVEGDLPLQTKCGLLPSHKQHPPHPFGGLCYDKHPVWVVTGAVTIPNKLPCVLRRGFIQEVAIS
jgi:hypothetical protein